MSNNPIIDPIKVREERERFAKKAVAMQDGAKAADALLWFAEHAKKPISTGDVIKVGASVVASATPNSQDANEFLRRAVESYADDILNAAIGLAQSAFDAANRRRVDQ